MRREVATGAPSCPRGEPQRTSVSEQQRVAKLSALDACAVNLYIELNLHQPPLLCVVVDAQWRIMMAQR